MHDDTEIESLLSRYRPAGPPPDLRARVLESSPERRLFRFRAFWPAIAAMMVINVGLYWTTERLQDQTSAILHSPTLWTANADEAVELLNGHGSGRPYIALALAASESTQLSRLKPLPVLPDALRSMQ